MTIHNQGSFSGGALAVVVGGTPAGRLSALRFDASENLCVADGGTVAYWADGLPFDANENLCIDSAGTASFWRRGLPFTAAGRLVADGSNAPVSYVNGGWPITATGGIAMTGLAFFAANQNLFFNDADYNAFSGPKTLVDAALLVTLGITDAGGVGGTYVNNSGNLATKSSGTAPRLQYDRGATSQLLTYSEDFSQAAWVATQNGTGTCTKTPNYSTAPDGTQTACRVVATKGNSSGYLIQTVTGLPNPHTYAVGVWVKSNTGANQTFAVCDGNAAAAYATATTSWTFVQNAGAAAATAGGILIGAFGAGSDASIDISIWHPQQNASPVATAYLKTTSTAPLYAAGTPKSQNLIGVSGDAAGSGWAAGGAYGNHNPTTVSGSTVTAVAGASASRSYRTSAVVPGCVYTLRIDGAAISGTWVASVVYSTDGSTYAGQVATGALGSPVQFVVPSGTKSIEVLLQMSVGSNGNQCTFNGAYLIEGTDTSKLGTATTGTPYSLYPQAGLLAEPAATNLHKYSGDFTQTGTWTYFSTVGAAVVGPDGTTNMQKLVPLVGSGDYYYYQPAALTNGTRVVWSCYYKQGEFGWVHMRPTDAGAGIWRAWFNLTTGTVGTVSGTGTVAGIEPGPNGTYRCWIAFTPTATGNGNCTMFVVNSDNTQTVVGVGTNGIYAWGSQVETAPVNDYPTTLIPTGAATVSRTAATNSWATANIPGFNGASVNRTWVVSGLTSNAKGSARLLGENASKTPAQINTTSNTSAASSYDGAVSAQAALGSGVWSTGQLIAVSMTPTRTAMSANGGTVGAVAGATSFAANPTTVYLGAEDAVGSNSFNGLLRRLAYSPNVASDAQLARLSAGQSS